ncbi:MAG: nucleotidyltransferase domain-containing protein [Porticoccaceae bacterium]
MWIEAAPLGAAFLFSGEIKINKPFTNTYSGFLITLNGYSMRDCKKISISDALFSGTRQKVLGLLFGQPERSFFLNEIIQLAQAGSGAVQREVERLHTSGLIKATQYGRQKSYAANPDSPIYEELCTLTRKLLGPEQRLKSHLENEKGVKLAILYGSVAKKLDTASSDIDLLLVSDALTLEEVFHMLEPLETELARPVNPTLYTSAEFFSRIKEKNPFLVKLLQGEHILLKGNINGQDAVG